MAVQSELKLEIIRPTKTELISISWVEVEGITGSFTVGPGHTPLVSILKPESELTYSSLEGSLSSIEVLSGIFSMSKDRAVVILDR